MHIGGRVIAAVALVFLLKPFGKGDSLFGLALNLAVEVLPTFFVVREVPAKVVNDFLGCGSLPSGQERSCSQFKVENRPDFKTGVGGNGSKSNTLNLDLTDFIQGITVAITMLLMLIFVEHAEYTVVVVYMLLPSLLFDQTFCMYNNADRVRTG